MIRTSIRCKDFTPRMSAAYDLFGNRKTALKFNFGEYLQEASNGGNYNANNVAAQLNNNAYTGSGNRAWTDKDADFVGLRHHQRHGTGSVRRRHAQHGGHLRRSTRAHLHRQLHHP